MGRCLRGFFVTVLVLPALIVGCAGEKASGPATASDPRRQLGSSTDATQGELRIAVGGSAPPFASSLNNDKSKVEGFAVDVGRKIVEIVSDGKVRAVFDNEWRTAEDLESGQVDLLMNKWQPTADDRTKLHLSKPYFSDGLRLVVRGDQGATTAQDLVGKQAGAFIMAASAHQRRLDEYLQEKQISGSIHFNEFNSLAEAVVALKQGKIAAVSGYTIALANLVKPDSGLIFLAERYETTPYTVVVLNKNVDLATAVDKAVQQMTESGELAQLAQKWGLGR